ncbi:MAG: helicase-associated domain-containing protein [Nitrolancea sp.]
MRRDARTLVFQNDHSILLMSDTAGFDSARDMLRSFAELQQAAGPYHVYRVSDLSLWSAAASGMSSRVIMAWLAELGQNEPPASLIAHIQRAMAAFGVLRLSGDPDSLRLESEDRALLRQIADEYGLKLDGAVVNVPASIRGWVKGRLAERGYPVLDEASMSTSPRFDFDLNPDVTLRPYQAQAVRRFVDRAVSGGVVLLPCGAGKTVVGVAIAASLGARTLIITPSRTIGDQWIAHFSSMTTVESKSIVTYRRGVPTGPITVATYQALTSSAGGNGAGLAEVLDQPWGLIIYDEVHSLPADVFRQSATVQSIRRLGLTATLVREDGREREVFSLVGPTVYSAPWRELERHGWIAPVDCVELRIHLSRSREVTADRMLAAKLKVVRRILVRHPDDATLLVAHRLTEVAAVSRVADAPMVTGQTPARSRGDLYLRFRSGDIRRLALSRVANVGVDLPSASILIQISGAFGSRQEEAQRVGRVLRPKASGDRATFYTLVIAGTREVEFAARRQRFLIDQGYRYRVLDVDST